MSGAAGIPTVHGGEEVNSMAASPDRPGRMKVPAARADLVGGEPRSWNQLIGIRRDG
jgi:hypothetical protein